MKKYISLFLVGLMFFSLCACKKAPAQSSPTPVPTAVPTETPEPTHTVSNVLPPEAETASVMAATMQKDETGDIWTSLAPLDGFLYVYDLLPEDAGYVYSFFLADGQLYAALKDDARAMDSARIYAIDIESGDARLLAENGSGACVFCLVGENTILYQCESGGLWAIDIAAGEAAEALPDAVSLLAAQNGWFYYTKADNGLYRNDSTLLSEEKLLDDCPSFWFATGKDGMCSLAYADETTALLEFRDLSGALRSRQPLTDIPSGLYTDGTLVYVPQPAAGFIAVYDIATGESHSTIPLPEEYDNIQLLYADSGLVCFQATKDGSFPVLRMTADGSGSEILAEDFIF